MVTNKSCFFKSVLDSVNKDALKARWSSFNKDSLKARWGSFKEGCEKDKDAVNENLAKPKFYMPVKRLR
ncbi:hypothetical protein AgCh_002206 [Apium graveolens]